jgi:hypothetical protein
MSPPAVRQLFLDRLRSSGGTGYARWNAAAQRTYDAITSLEILKSNTASVSSVRCFNAGCSADITTKDFAAATAIGEVVWSAPVDGFPGPKALTVPLQSPDGTYVRTFLLYNPEIASRGFIPD